ncbi:Hypothetical predicted protein [Paramuricea clavata]|uniref:Uncharacterized protein n=1 Tax=Paramuricea clavata TaxID=317549 RepID=A0A6S7FWF8_PARCT|nr:Hypothetical predicted protein [Paramuricea clavata]
MLVVFKKYFPIKDFNFSYLQRTCNHRLKSSKYKSSFNFPWIQNLHDDKKSAPFLHKVLGFFIMKKILNNVNTPFNKQEFLEGTQLAIGAVSNAISTQDTTKLQEMMGVQLSQCFKNAFLSLSEKQHKINLDLEKTSIINITGVKSTFGKADPSDKHILKVCGQEIVGSKRKLQTAIEESESPWNDSKDIGAEAAKLGVTFQIDVKFKTEERFSICSDDTNEVLAGSNEFQHCYHTWKFESYVDWITWDKSSNESYPISWQVSDMDRFLETNFPDENSFDTII